MILIYKNRVGMARHPKYRHVDISRFFNHCIYIDIRLIDFLFFIFFEIYIRLIVKAEGLGGEKKRCD